jgi:hypothetical protein
MNLFETIKEARDPWIISEQKRVLREGDSVEYGRFLVENYHNDSVCKSIIEAYRSENSHESKLIDTIISESLSLNEDGYDPSASQEKKGGIFSKIGDWAKKATRKTFDFIYKLRKGTIGDKDADKAEAAYEKMMTKYEGIAGKTVKKLFDEIKEKYPNFPNTDGNDAEEAKRRAGLAEDLSAHAVFVNGLLNVAAFYDTVVKQHQDEEITTDQANEIIADLRAGLNKMSKDLSAVYTRFKESNQLTTLSSVLFERSSGESNLLDIKAGEDTAETKRLKNKTFEKIMAAIGLGALGTAAALKIFSGLYSSIGGGGGVESVTKAVTNYWNGIVGNVKPGEGLTQILQRFTNVNLGPNSTRHDLIRALEIMGGGDPHKAVDSFCQQAGIAQNPELMKQALDEILRNPEYGSKKLGEIFTGNFAGTGKSIGDMLVTKPGGAIAKYLVQRTMITITKTTAAAAIGGGSTAALALTAGAMATPLAVVGATALVIGAASYWLKQKGLKSSRSAAIQP